MNFLKRFFHPPEMTYSEVADLLGGFVEGTGGDWDWDNFFDARFEDPYLKSVQHRCAFLDREFPARKGQGYCGPAGIEVIRDYIEELRAKAGERRP
jgi:hypothetical protein